MPQAPRKDTIFRNYSATAAQTYATIRPSYPAELYSFILSRHEQTGGQFATLLDVGCGPGNATRDLAPAFEHATGADPGAEMIAMATKLGGKAKESAISWRVAGAEEIADEEKAGFAEGNVDLLTAAMAAHWFDMPAFWKQAARLVKPGGSVAIFCRSSYFCHPTTPNIEEVQRIFDDFEKTELAPYGQAGHSMTREFYSALSLPWNSEDGGSPEFPQDKFERHVWNVDGSLDAADGTDFFGGSLTLTFPQLEKLMGTASLITMWRKDHPEAEGTDKDIVKIASKKLQAATGASEIKIGTGFALLFLKRT
ncbi:hypothetical protein SLS57_005973 [Botryosphaeria dothidea]